jgi:hypothetical protein
MPSQRLSSTASSKGRFPSLAATASPELEFPGASRFVLPQIETRREDRSYSCRRLLFWHSGFYVRSNLGLCETRGQPDCNTGYLRIYAEAGTCHRWTGRECDHRPQKMQCFIFFRDALQCTALRACKSSSLHMRIITKPGWLGWELIWRPRLFLLPLEKVWEDHLTESEINRDHGIFSLSHS